MIFILFLMLPVTEVFSATIDLGWGLVFEAGCSELISNTDYIPENKIQEKIFQYGTTLKRNRETGELYQEVESTRMQVPRTELEYRDALTTTPGLTMFEEHRNAMNRYFQQLRDERDLKATVVDLFEETEKSLPLNRIRLQMYTGPKGELIGMVRHFDGSKKLFPYASGTLGPQVLNPFFVQRLRAYGADDSNYLFPFERSLKKRGAISKVADQYRELYPDASLVETGRAYRKKGSMQGAQAKLFWEISIIAQITESVHAKGFFFIHTDRLGKRLFIRDYGAEVKETFVPTGKFVDEIEQYELHVGEYKTNDSELEKKLEYVLVASDQTMIDHIVRRFNDDPLTLELRLEMQRLDSRYMIMEMKANLLRR